MNAQNIEDVRDIVGGYNILLVEDDSLIHEQLKKILGRLFKKIYIAENGRDGLETFKNNRDINIIISDINMPNMNGFEMVEKIKEIDKDVPILILSAHSESHQFIQSIKLGVDGYLIKPIDFDQLMRSIMKATIKIKFQDELLRKTNLLKQYKEAADESIIVSKTDLHGKITYVNKKFCDICGYKKSELIGKSHSILRDSKTSTSVYKDMWHTIKDKKKIWQGVIMNKAKSGDSYYTDATIKPILDLDNNIIEYISLRNDITEIISPKRLLGDVLKRSIEPMVVMVKIDNFDDIEKYYGLDMLEKIEKIFEVEFFNLFPNSCEFEKIYSLGDGIYALSKDKTKCSCSIDEMEQNLKKLQKSIAGLKLDIGELDYDISVVISLSYGKDALSNAKYGLKKLEDTKQKFIIANELTKKEHFKAQENLQTLTMVKKAIDNLNIVSYFQPIINNKTQKIKKYESLVRLIDENGKILSPFFFLDAAKKGNYYSQITSMVLDNSFAALDFTDVDISINLSILDIEKKSIREKIFSLLRSHKINLHRVVFELLEDEDAEDFELVKSFIDEVKSMGVKIAIDDFGTGYSNFERLLDYRPDILKIDGSLVKNIETNPLSLHIVEMIIAFAKKQNIKTIAEFVETEAIFDILKGLGVDYSQGYYFGKPDILTKR